jgi:ATP-dependent DNA helicase RecG
MFHLAVEETETLRNLFVQLCVQPASVLESETLEVKGWCASEKQLSEKASDSSACLANAHGGIVLLGIEDKDRGARKFSTCPYRDVTPEWIAQRIQDGTVPPVEMRVVDASGLLQEASGNANVNCFAVLVAKSRRIGGHQTVGGLSRIRTGKDCRPYYVAAEDDRTKAPVDSADARALSFGSIAWGIEQHKKKFGLQGEQWESEIGFLAHIGLLESRSPCANAPAQQCVTLAGLLLFGTERALQQICPGLETIVISPMGEKRLRTNIVESFRQLCGSRGAILNSLCPAIPDRCIKEILMNCFVHRDYRVHSPIVIRATQQSLEFESPGGLCTGLSSESLLYCTPVYRNFLLAEGARYLGLCDKVGRGIDAIYESVLNEGFGFPVFENGENHFTARLSLAGSREFQEFLKRRAQSLSQLDEIIVVRFLFDRESATFRELCAVMQRGNPFAHRILSEMARKSMIESDSSLNLEWRLSPIVRSDIQNIFRIDQYDLGFTDLFGEWKLEG